MRLRSPRQLIPTFIPTNQAKSAYYSRRSRHGQHPEQVEHDPSKLQRQPRPFMLYYDI